jgi:anti-sigma factor RsiW
MTEQEAAQGQLHEELTSYLDGELDAENVRRVESRLARDSAYRAELQRLQRAWDLLDRLPRANVPESFTQTTMEMVAVAAAQEAEAVQKSLPARQRRQRLLGAFGVLAAVVAGFAIGHVLWPNPNEQLLEDLPVLQKFDLYYQADNLEFLQLLDREGVFAEGETDNAP